MKTCEHCGAPLQMKPGEKVKMARVNAGLTQSQLAKSLKLSRTTIVNIENSKQGITVDIVVKICKQLGISSDWMLGLK